MNRSVTPPGKSSSPPPLPAERGSKRSSRDVSHDESISILDPRRFTPTLHANLVSEILNLRRDQEEKIKIIESLESTLHETRGESETLQATVASSGKENRSLKRQLTLLEGGTSSALADLARERDEAVDSNTEIKKRLETAQRRLRSQDEDSERVHKEWAKEKDEWEEEKRKYERKIHVAETRLNVLLDEVAAFQAAHVNGTQHDVTETDVEEGARENDGASVRTMSMTNSIRFSTVSAAAKVNGHSLADELNFEGDDSETDYGGRESTMSYNRHNTSRDSMLSRTHRRNMSNDSLIRTGSIARGRMGLHHSTLERLEGDIIREDDEIQVPTVKCCYTDTGVQYSPPPSPKMVPTKPSTPEPPVIRMEKPHGLDSPSRGDWEVEANQRKKRVSLVRPLVIDATVNGASQTMGGPLSPPRTPQTPYEDRTPTPEPSVAPSPVRLAHGLGLILSVTSTATQTDLPPPLQSSLVVQQQQQQQPLPIPSISIIPPTSRPSTPRDPQSRLPQLTKDVGCQVTVLSSPSMASVAVQTEEIRIDKRRLEMLPPHLRPSAITSRPTSPAPSMQETPLHETRHFTPIPGNLPPRNPRRLASNSSLTDFPSSPPLPFRAEQTRDAYPGNNDDGPLSSQSNQKAPVRRPHRISSLFAGFDGGSSDEVDEFGDAEVTDSEYRTALSAPRPQAGISMTSKRMSGSTTTTMSPEPVYPTRMSSIRYSARPSAPESHMSFSFPENKDIGDMSGHGRPASKAMSRSSVATSNKSSGIRKAAMIQNGIATHQRARSPSLPGLEEPPFPIPTRASSRKLPHSASAPSDGRASPTMNTDSWQRRGGRNHSRTGSIRKVRSAAALPGKPRYRRHGSRSPPRFGPSLETPESPEQLPPLPNQYLPTNRDRETNASHVSRHQYQPSTNTANTTETGYGSVGSSNQTTTVVDAIAQTMVGEWMFKYVRRRKSFGVGESKGGDDSSNDRHKRWVWLAPYERAILWSSKQPVSGSALMGKAGRKREYTSYPRRLLTCLKGVVLIRVNIVTIQSVLDVKDDNPPPKGSGPLFNRSILILTPQRALKFTATSAERHYIWLTSLSFLAHSQQAIPEIAPPVVSSPPKPIPEQYAIPLTKARKANIRDSIRLAKGKTTYARPGAVSVASSRTDSVPPSVSTYHRETIPEDFAFFPTHERDYSRDAAEPPYIPRFADRANPAAVHGRKRSNTGGHVPPPISFRGFSGPVGNSSTHHTSSNSISVNSIGTAGSSDIYNNSSSQAGSNGPHMTWAMSTTGPGSVRTSEASSRPSGPNFFDAIGTVRMEAFISPLAFPQEQDEMRYLARRKSKELRRRASRSRHRYGGDRDSYQSKSTRTTADDMGGGNEDWYHDPFKGF